MDGEEVGSEEVPLAVILLFCKLIFAWANDLLVIMYFERVSLIDIELIPGLSVSGTLMLISIGDCVFVLDYPQNVL